MKRLRGLLWFLAGVALGLAFDLTAWQVLAVVFVFVLYLTTPREPPSPFMQHTRLP